MRGPRLKVLYAYHSDPRDPHVQSGRPYSILRQMTEHGHEVDVLLTPRARLGRFTPRKAWSILAGHRYGTERNPRNSRAYAKAVERHLAGAGDSYDCLFSPNTWVFSDLEHPIAKIACADMLIDEFIRTYLAPGGVDAFYVEEANRMERQALAKLDLLIVPSRSAELNARDFYGMPAERVARVAFGGNLNIRLSAEERDAVIEQRLSQPVIEFLFVGRDWPRKNGALVARTCAVLAARGIAVHAHFVGLEQPKDFPQAWRRFSTFHGLLDLRVPTGVAQLRELANRCSFFFMPSRAEGAGLALAEAAALALPLISSPVGGIADVVTDENGLLIDPDGDPEGFAAQIVAIRSDRERYRKMARAAHTDSETRLNWRSFWQDCEPRFLAAVARRRELAGLNPQEPVRPPS